VIAMTSSGRRFLALARYLVHGRSGREAERVAWTAGRHLGTDDPELAAALMQATADENVRVRSPVYHLTISFDPHDPMTPERMRDIADFVLADLGLAEHQALLVAHQDRAHPHVHVMVNRVHPETGIAWERWQDRPRIERSLRELERAFALREVNGRLFQLDGQPPPERALLTTGERRQALRTGELAFPDRVRAHLPELRAAQNWVELEDRLAAHGLRLERKGQGLIITDGEHQVKASRVARDLSLFRLEQRFGVPYPGRDTELARREPPSRDVVQLQAALVEYERIRGLEHQRDQATADLSTLNGRAYTLTRALAEVPAAENEFVAALGRVYRDPEAARARFLAALAQDGPQHTLASFTHEPERFGPLRTEDRPRAHTLGLLVRRDPTCARQAAEYIPGHWTKWQEGVRRAAALAREHGEAGPDPNPLPALERARTRLQEQVGKAKAHLGNLKEEIAAAPSRDLLARSIGGVVARLEPRELTQLRAYLTAPHRALAFQAREAIKDVLLGRDRSEELER
jgi:hypothetical protein